MGSFTNKFASYSSELSQATAAAAAACQLKVIAIYCQRVVPHPWQVAKLERDREGKREHKGRRGGPFVGVEVQLISSSF